MGSYWPVESYRDPIGRTLSGPYRENASIGKWLLYRDGPYREMAFLSGLLQQKSIGIYREIGRIGIPRRH